MRHHPCGQGGYGGCSQGEPCIGLGLDKGVGRVRPSHPPAAAHRVLAALLDGPRTYCPARQLHLCPAPPLVGAPPCSVRNFQNHHLPVGSPCPRRPSSPVVWGEKCERAPREPGSYASPYPIWGTPLARRMVRMSPWTIWPTAAPSPARPPRTPVRDYSSAGTRSVPAVSRTPRTAPRLEACHQWSSGARGEGLSHLWVATGDLIVSVKGLGPLCLDVSRPTSIRLVYSIHFHPVRPPPLHQRPAPRSHYVPVRVYLLRVHCQHSGCFQQVAPGLLRAHVGCGDLARVLLKKQVLTEAVQVYLLVTLFGVVISDDIRERGVPPLVGIYVYRTFDVQLLEFTTLLPSVPDFRDHPAAVCWGGHLPPQRFPGGLPRSALAVRPLPSHPPLPLRNKLPVNVHPLLSRRVYYPVRPLLTSCVVGEPGVRVPGGPVLCCQLSPSASVPLLGVPCPAASALLPL
eukprot:1191349-Prorocentrum_minimum.AAC.3